MDINPRSESKRIVNLMSDGITCYLRGGLGNQLFIYAAAYQFSKSIDCNLLLDTSWFSREPMQNGDTQRNFELGTLISDEVILDFNSPWAGLDPNGMKSKLFVKLRHPQLNVFAEGSRGIPKRGSTLTGYFQNPIYFEEVKSDLFSKLMGGTRHAYSSDRITIHVRRGDYLNSITKDFHGLVSPSYLEQAMSLFRKNTDFRGFQVFSDSLELVKKEIPFYDDCLFINTDYQPPIEVLRQMSGGKGMIMSNSSFSWWAASIMSQDSSQMVVAPSPWYETAAVSDGFIDKNWIELKK